MRLVGDGVVTVSRETIPTHPQGAALSTDEGAGDDDTALAELRRQPRDASATRVRNRDAVDGRPRAYFREFGVSRVRLRQMAHDGELPGVTKSSW